MVWYRPKTQLVQSDSEVAPDLDEDFPATHCMHALKLVPPGLPCQCPAGQRVHCSFVVRPRAALYLPAEQFSHCGFTAEGQSAPCKQVDEDNKAEPSPNVPCGQLVDLQKIFPSSSWYWSFFKRHRAHPSAIDVWPGCFPIRPTSHFVQSSDRSSPGVDDQRPTSQAKQASTPTPPWLLMYIPAGHLVQTINDVSR